jgi:predicted amidohydrolase
MLTMKCAFAALLAIPLICGSASAAVPGKIAVVQYRPAFGQTETNIDRLTAYADEAVRGGANLVLFPEGAIFGYDSGAEVWCKPGMSSFQTSDGDSRECRDVSEVAELVPFDPTTQYWRTFAMERGIYVLFNIIEVSSGEYYNTLVALDPQGSVTPYRKRILFETEYPYASSGDDSVLLETPFGKFGLMICIDGFDTNAVESLDRGFYTDYKAAGADAILIPMNWDTYDADNEFAAQSVFTERARRFGIDIFASDAYNGTARYWASGIPRDRGGLPTAVNSEGVSYHTVNY